MMMPLISEFKDLGIWIEVSELMWFKLLAGARHATADLGGPVLPSFQW
jgi:hypothetical protein